MDSLHENHTYELTKLPRGKKALRNKWVYKLKPGKSGNPPRYRARIVVKGFQQKKGVDFDEIFAPVVKMTSIHTVLSISTNMDLEVEKLGCCEGDTTVLERHLEHVSSIRLR